MTQMDLFDSQQIQNLRDEIAKVDKGVGNVRRGLFARHTALDKSVSDLELRLESLERELYRLRAQVSTGVTEIHEHLKVLA